MSARQAMVSLVKCKDYNTDHVENAVRVSVGLLGGIEKFIRPGSRVLVKPNVLSGREPHEGVNTHPEVIRAVIRILKGVTTQICVGDSPGGFGLREIDEVYKNAGLTKVCQEEGVKLVKFDKIIEMGGFPIAQITREVDAIVSVPKFKTHSTTILTGAIKNMFGVVVGLSKAQCHIRAPGPEELAVLLTEVFGLARPALSIMDGIVGMEGGGPAAGPLRTFGLLIASADAVALDAVFADIVGLDPLKIPLIREACKKGHGVAHLDKIEVVGETVKDVKVKDFKLPKAIFYYKLPGFILKAGMKNITFFPCIDKKKCRRCGLCHKICPKTTIEKDKKGAYTINEKGCIKCLCCYEVCPYKAIGLKRSLLARIIMR